jgi:methylenetetrahydrofolate reductase (NADPH)
MGSSQFGRGLSADERAALARLVASPVFELIPLDRAREAAAALPSGASVTVTVSVRLSLDATLGLAEWLSSRGHDVAPHLAARMIRDRAHLADVLERMRIAGIGKVFVVGGDGAPTGDLTDGLALIRAIRSADHAFDEIGVPAYPEGHVKIPSEVLLRDLQDKQPCVHLMTTQMSFNPGAVADWIEHVRGEAVTLPIHLGIPGAVEMRKLMNIATRIGVADSTRYLLKHRSLLGHLVQGGSFGPDVFLRDLAPTLAHPRADVRALHVFTMNQVEATLVWQRRMLEELGESPGSDTQMNTQG